MNRTRALPTDNTSEQKAAGQLIASSGLQLRKAALNFDQTDVGDESFLTLKIASPRLNTLVVVSVQDPALFQIAVGVDRLAYKQVLTFKPAPTGTYIHIRYTPEHAGRHQSVLLVEAPVTDETVNIPLLGHTGGLAAIGLPSVNLLPTGEPIVGRPNRSLLATLLIGSLVVGASYAGYVYRCQIWPDSCGPSVGLSTSVDDQSTNRQTEPARSVPVQKQPVAVEPESELAPERVETRSTTAERTQSTDRVTEDEAPARRERSQTDDTEEEAPTRTKVADKAPVREELANSEEKEDVPVIRRSADRSMANKENTVQKSTARAKPATVQRTQPAPVAARPRPAAKPTASEESELEQILNKGGN